LGQLLLHSLLLASLGLLLEFFFAAGLCLGCTASFWLGGLLVILGRSLALFPLLKIQLIIKKAVLDEITVK
jgi:hypothetical protein